MINSVLGIFNSNSARISSELSRKCPRCFRFISSSSNSNSSSTISSPIKKKEFPPNNTLIMDKVSNRNPRNLEKLRIAEKISGWDLEKEGRSYWNKLTIELTGRHITAKVVHVLGQIPVSASTNEWCIKKFLYNTRDSVSAKTIGQVLAHRCLQVGITELSCYLSEEDRKKEKISLIIGALEDGGVTLEEPGQIEIPWSLNYPTMPEKSWEVHEDISDQLDEADKLLHYFKKAPHSK
ncbi:39S ribosomal protein L18, mitochondrial [Folsomia candida]|uniref:Large ribosomal subunit protein uL18m n=1 Tax=Folsomia candida TaxID=158441 RepID=A0A226EZ25_FOLCA|nr:39S ribosomal protein L18, mitochondrial [Folsomia candida]OXA62374.1 hypothetical protein Fcan01_03511 [Folsomia candida]